MQNFNFEIPKFDLKEFSMPKVGLRAKFDNRIIKPPKMKDVPDKHLKYRYAEDMAKEIEITEGCRYFAIINGTFIFGDFIEALIVQKNYHVKRLTISTLCYSENNVDSLRNLIDGDYIDKLDIIVSDYFFSHERHNLIRYTYQELDKTNKCDFQLAVAGTHCKTVTIETHCGKFIVIHGSANLRSSSNIEQICIEENKELFDFNNEYQDTIINTFKTINKSIRANETWALVDRSFKPISKKLKVA